MSAALVQVAITAFGVAALVMAMSNHAGARKWAPVVGLAGQPFWVIFAVQTNAGGVLTLTVAYTFAYLLGLHSQWWPR